MSFEKKIHFFRCWKNGFQSILGMGVIFLPWDIWFTGEGIWGFNPTYLVGVDVVNLPIEEWLFFITVPFASLFIYENIKFFVKEPFTSNWFAYILASLLMVGALIWQDQWYTGLTFFLASIFLFLTGRKTWFSHFIIAYLIVLIPFLLVNGILTGLFTDAPIVWYNENHIIGARIGTIPVEDTIYNLLMMGLVVWFYEALKTNQKSNKKG